jgi:hypothetical protein
VLVGGGVPQFGDPRDQGYWVEPTVITGLPYSEITNVCVRIEGRAAPSDR